MLLTTLILFPSFLSSRKKQGIVGSVRIFIYLSGVFLLILPRVAAWSFSIYRRAFIDFEVFNSEILMTYSGFLSGLIKQYFMEGR